MDFRRQGLSPCLSLLMSTFSLLITPPDASRPGFTVRTLPPLSRRIEEAAFIHRTLRYHALKECIQSFGSWLEPRYIFAARPLI